MASIPGARYNLTGASGSQGLIAPCSSWKNYVLPRGGYASQASAGTLITFDSASVAARFAALNWIQVGLLTANIRQVAAVGGNSLSVSGGAVTVAKNDRVFLIGNTQPTVVGGSATYTIPASFIRQRDDDAADLYTNSMVTTDANGLVQFFADANTFDVLVQDANGSLQASIIDLEVGNSSSAPSVFANLTVNGILGVTGTAYFGSTVTLGAALGVTGTAVFGSTVTMNAALGVTGAAVFGATLTASGRFVAGQQATFGQTATFTGPIAIGSSAGFLGGLSVSSGVFGVSDQPRFLLYMSSASVTLPNGTSVAVVWTAEEFDVGNFHSGSTSTRATVPAGAGGLYLFGAYMPNIDTTAGSPWSVQVVRNNNKIVAEARWSGNDSGANLFRAFSCSGPDFASAGDYYEAVLLVTSAGQSITGGTRSKLNFWGVKLS